MSSRFLYLMALEAVASEIPFISGIEAGGAVAKGEIGMSITPGFLGMIGSWVNCETKTL